MTYSVKELFLTIQGEGAQTGRVAVFCRFAGCNLWSGREQDRGSAICQFCDTDFVGTDGEGGGRYDSPQALAQAIDAAWGKRPGAYKYVVFTGGEPLLQLDSELIHAVHALGFTIAIETNGTLAVPPGVDWICVSPKAGSALVQTTGHELKLVIPQHGHFGTLESVLANYEKMAFEHYFLQPMDGPNARENAALAITLCQKYPRWRLSTQTHKIHGIR